MGIKEIIKKSNIKQEKIFFEEPMSKHTSFKIGGNAECYIIVETLKDLKEVLEIATRNQIHLTVLGRGTNVLVKDEGIKGITLSIEIKKIEIDEEQQTVKLGAGNTISEVAQKMMQNNLSGLEELSGIPGTIGGAVRMNAGAHGKEIKDIITNVTAIDYNGNIRKFTNENCEFEYRNSVFSKEKYIILEAEIKLKKENKEEIKKKMLGYAIWRKEHQPLEYPNAGSTFKRGEDFITAKLIDECNLKGYEVGGAQISTKHAGFIINTGNATAKEVLELVEITKRKVHEKFGKEIKLEIEVIGLDEDAREERILK